jgi:hypothetical protein
MTSIAIMQPTYLPWLGYFDLIDRADAFVLLDSVQFSYQSWQHRNRIRTVGGMSWITIPVRREGRLGKRLDEIELGTGTRFPKSHIDAVRTAYRDAPHADLQRPVLDTIEAAANATLLADVTIPVIQTLLQSLGLKSTLVRSSELSVAGRRTELLIAICQHFGASCYLSPLGAASYLAEDRRLFEEAGIEVMLQRYEHPVYPQCFEPFLSHVSTIDALGNIGSGTLGMLRSGQREWTPLDEWSEVLSG